MKLTEKVKAEIDSYSANQIVTLFRFHPCDMTTGETGRYIQTVARERIIREKENQSQSDSSSTEGFKDSPRSSYGSSPGSY